MSKVVGLTAKHGAMVDALRAAGYVLCIWTPLDVKCDSTEEGFDFLNGISDDLEDAMTAAGWEVIGDDGTLPDD